MKDCSSPNIVTFYGAFLNDAGDVIMCMEYMDAGYVPFLLTAQDSNNPGLWTEFLRTLDLFE